MSKYENYSKTANHYDATRTAIGHDIWLGHLYSKFAKPTKIRLLDAGCGTGNYMMALAPHVGHISALDMNPQMLANAKAKAKSAGLDDKIEFHTGRLPELPFDDESHDIVMFNQVLHHLEVTSDNQFTGIDEAFSESARILRKGGLILVNTCSNAQMERGYWYHALIKQASQRGLSNSISSKKFAALLEKNGFEKSSRTVPVDALLQGAGNFNMQGPLDPTWRAGDSIWAYASEAELANAIAQTEEMIERGTMETFMREHDQPRLQIGQTTFWCAKKPA